MKFLSEAHAKSLMQKTSIIGTIKQNVAGMEKARCFKTVHASDVTKDGFCPRKLALLTLTDQKLPGQYIPTYLRTTFDMGHAVSDLVREEWLGDAAVGDWLCRRCMKMHKMTPKPESKGCHEGMMHLWSYQEVTFASKASGIEGSIDVFVRLGIRLVATELKIMAPSQFDELVAPLAEHRIRTSLYLRLIEDSTHPYKDAINLQQGRVLYVSRGAGKKHPEFGEVMPFKEFVVDRNDADTEKVWALGSRAVNFFRGGTMPGPICKTATDKHAVGCPMKKACFSGDYAAGSAVLP